MYRALEHLDRRNHFMAESDHSKVKNEWDNDEEVVFQLPSSEKAAK